MKNIKDNKGMSLIVFTIIIVILLVVAIGVIIYLLNNPVKENVVTQNPSIIQGGMTNNENKVISGNLDVNNQNSIENKIEINTTNINIEDYVGIWYENESLKEYSDVCIDLDEDKNILVEVGIYRLTTFDNLKATLNGNIITLTKNNDFIGTLTLGNNKIIFNYSVEDLNIENEKVEFTYKRERTSTEVLNGYDISGEYTCDAAGPLKINKDNTYKRSIINSGESFETEKDLTGTYKIIGNKIIFTSNNNKEEIGIYEGGAIEYFYKEDVSAKFYPEN